MNQTVIINKRGASQRCDFIQIDSSLSFELKIYIYHDCIGVVMVIVFTLSAVDHEFETPRTMKLIFVAVPLSTQH